jgi:hypothetical protein
VCRGQPYLICERRGTRLWMRNALPGAHSACKISFSSSSNFLCFLIFTIHLHFFFFLIETQNHAFEFRRILLLRVTCRTFLLHRGHHPKGCEDSRRTPVRASTMTTAKVDFSSCAFFQLHFHVYICLCVYAPRIFLDAFNDQFVPHRRAVEQRQDRALPDICRRLGFRNHCGSRKVGF